MKHSGARRRIVAADIGGTHARFAVATIGGGEAIELEAPVLLKTGEHEGFEQALDAFRPASERPSHLAIAFAGPVEGERLQLTNSDWVIDRSALPVERVLIVNDFGAVAHAVACLPDTDFAPICGPDRPLPREGVVTVVGPGTGLGVAVLLRRGDSYEVIETEGGHISYTPLDDLDRRVLLSHLEKRFGRVSAERVVSGPGLANIYEAFGGDPVTELNRLWAAALDGSDPRASAALDRLCFALGAVAGDLALAHGASAVVIAGGVGARLGERLRSDGFVHCFTAKGRMGERMAEVPVKLITHPQPGLFGAAAAFARSASARR